MKNKLIVTAALSMTSLSAQAVEYPYIGVDYLHTEYTSSKYSGDVSPEAVRVRFGSVLSDHFALEAHLVGGIDGYPVRVPGNTYDVRIDGIYSAGAVGRLALGEAGSLYVYGGVSHVRLSAESKNPAFDDQDTTDNGASYGAGIAFRVWRGWLVEADYTSYLDSTANELNVVGVGARHSF